MASPPRILLPGKFTLITSRVQEGLPFIPRLYMEVILWSIIARAQHLYQTVITDLIFMGNHLHLLCVVNEPADVVAFMDRIKTETAHAVNRLLGRRNRTVWNDDYDAVPILTLENAIDKIVYLHTNPQEAKLVPSIDEYPGVSTWKMRILGIRERVAKWIRRPSIEALRNLNLSHDEDLRLTNELLSKSAEEHKFTLSPDAWFACFGVTDPDEISRINAEIVKRVREFERELQEKQTRFLGRERLIGQPVNMTFAPKKRSRRMWCICSDIPIRVNFIRFIKALRAEARRVRERWKIGDYSVSYPLGLFPPSLPKIGNLVPHLEGI